MSDNIPKPFPMKRLVAPEQRTQRVSNKAMSYANPVITPEVAQALRNLTPEAAEAVEQLIRVKNALPRA